jgi:ferric-dicitrate binding protein FerR (iron transport regulator)
MKETFEIAELIIRKIDGSITPEQEKKLADWVSERPENESVLKRATDPKNHLDRLEVYRLFGKEKVWSAIDEQISSPGTIRLNSRRIMSYAAAVLLPIMIAGIAWIYLGKKEQPGMATIDTVIQPGSQKAMLILSDGATVEFDEDEPLEELEQAEALIRNENNTLVYSEKKKAGRSRKPVYNELRTPRGGGYNLTLADGSKVWLNAGSSIRFPVSFTDSTRHVYLEGEAYFQVSHDGKPFIVSSGELDVRVLGTSFNVLAYPDEQQLVTTLVEGSVRIDYGGKDDGAAPGRILSPDDQAVVSIADAAIEVAKVNTSQFISWIDGKLEFHNEDLDKVMKRLARWYDFKYEFENQKAREFHFSARFDNTENISTILEMLELTTNVKFELKENTIVVI